MANIAVESGKMKYSLVILDFDGTLVDSERCITAAMAEALSEMEVSGDLTRLRRHIGLSLEQSIRGVVDADLDETKVAEIARSYRRRYASLQDNLVEAYPGAQEALDRLSGRGVTLAIASSKLTTAVRATLQRLDLARCFTYVVGGEQVVKGKPDPEILELVLSHTKGAREAALMVGDTTFDVEMAQRAGIDSCAVTYGYHSTARLSGAGPTHLAASLSEVADFVIGSSHVHTA